MRIKEAEQRRSDHSLPFSMDKCICGSVPDSSFFLPMEFLHGLELGVNTTLTGREGDCVAPQLFLIRPFLFFLNVTTIDIEPVREEPANPESRWEIMKFLHT